MTKFRILDLFSGAGGFSKGLDSLEAFETVLATDFNKSALETFKMNFPESKTIYGDITQQKIKKDIIESAKTLKVNMIIGGLLVRGSVTRVRNLD